MKQLLPIINLCLAAAILVGLVWILRIVRRLRRSTAPPPGNRWNVDGYEDLGDLRGVNIRSTSEGSTITRGGKVVYQSKGNRVEIDKRGRIKGSRT